MRLFLGWAKFRVQGEGGRGTTRQTLPFCWPKKDDEISLLPSLNLPSLDSLAFFSAAPLPKRRYSCFAFPERRLREKKTGPIHM